MTGAWTTNVFRWPMISLLRKKIWIFLPQFSDRCWAEGNLPLLSYLSWPIQAHAATRALIPHCNVPDPWPAKRMLLYVKSSGNLTPWTWRYMHIVLKHDTKNIKHFTKHNHSYTQWKQNISISIHAYIDQHLTCISSFINGKYIIADTS